MLTIGLIDNYVIMRLGLSILLNEHFKNIEFLESGSISEFSKVHSKKVPDIIIMGNNDITQAENLNAATFLKHEFPNTPLVIYDEQLSQNLTVRYFKIGINGYILKESIARELINCLDAVLERRQFLCPILLERLLKYLVRKEIDDPDPVILTPRELEIAQYLSQGKKTSWIAKRLSRKPSTISTIKSNIFKKMKVENVMELNGLLSKDLV